MHASFQQAPLVTTSEWSMPVLDLAAAVYGLSTVQRYADMMSSVERTLLLQAFRALYTGTACPSTTHECADCCHTLWFCDDIHSHVYKEAATSGARKQAGNVWAQEHVQQAYHTRAVWCLRNVLVLPIHTAAHTGGRCDAVLHQCCGNCGCIGVLGV